MLLVPVDLFCMTRVHRVLQQVPVRTVFSQSVRALSSKLCDCKFPECKMSKNPNLRMICQEDICDDVDYYNNINHEQNNNKPYSAAEDFSSVRSDNDSGGCSGGSDNDSGGCSGGSDWDDRD